MITEILLNNTNKKGPRVKDEKILRSVLKSISWRLIGTIDTIIISYLITGTLEFALRIGFIELITKMGLYFLHERLWNKIKWGK
ncbi:DUF2061 domain-containing protein [Flavobacteriaceae bacterium]|nr:DUF2061 domain-containing protein [Flavobacteriaceae bacterium]MDB4738705.1 DUF2061 domain-containing protein [Flavobacteriaceae bacterium]MDC0960241.1 DUF2061 domain-containing protein [Flavobacteriaceae bacterium]